ncbi:MAG: hypothetical protein HF973_05920 [Chloroflexi bacterium]|nr:hypothetical protein [Chloroflexota bacterium]
MTSITVELPRETYQRASRLAQLTNRKVSDVLTETLTLSLPPFTTPEEIETALTNLPDEKIIELTNLEMQPDEDRRLSLLLDKQQAGELNTIEKEELSRLMQLYQEGLLRKAWALSEAVKRGLIEPLTP